MTVVYDAGLLIAAQRNDRDVWAAHRVRLEAGIVPITTAPVAAQVIRSPRQVQLRRLLRGCDIVAFEPDQAERVGSLLAGAKTSDVVGAHVVLTAAKTGSVVITSDVEDLEQLCKALSRPVPIRRV
jgi:predicted nucleic acid-binding protein